MQRPLLLALLLLVPLRAPVGGQQPGPTALRWPTVGAVSGIVVASILVDASLARRFADTPSAGRLQTARRLKTFGEAPAIAGISGGLAVVGWVGRRPALVRLAGQTAAAILLETVVTQATKEFVGRARPFQDPDRDGLDFAPLSGQTAFPSGHSAAAFALATTLGDASHSTWARAGLYTLATGTAWARLCRGEALAQRRGGGGGDRGPLGPGGQRADQGPGPPGAAPASWGGGLAGALLVSWRAVHNQSSSGAAPAPGQPCPKEGADDPFV